MHYVYALLDPYDQQPRYIGISKDPKRRLYHHWSTRYYHGYNKNKKTQWLRSLPNEPECCVLSTWETEEEARKEERRFILATPLHVNSQIKDVYHRKRALHEIRYMIQAKVKRRMNMTPHSLKVTLAKQAKASVI